MENNFWDDRSEKYEQNLKKNSEIIFKTLEWSKPYFCKTDNVLDFGCATGEYSLELSSQVYSITGIDTSKKMIERAERKRNEQQVTNVSFLAADINSKQVEENTYSAILTLSILHLVDNPSATIKKMNNILDDNGYVISVTPCLRNRKIIFRFLMYLFQRLGIAPKIQSFSFLQLESLFKENGFRIITSKVLDSKNALYWIVGKKADNNV